MREAKRLHPQVKNLLHIQGSVITHWRNEYGLMEAMVMARHLHVISTKRYETKKYDALQELLRNIHIHPMEHILNAI